MGKIFVFLPMIIFMGFFLALIVGFFFLIYKLISKSKADSWQGKVIDKKFVNTEDTDDHGHHHKETLYHLVVKTDDGRERKIGLARQKYDEYSVGDKIKKEAGKLFPEKVG